MTGARAALGQQAAAAPRAVSDSTLRHFAGYRLKRAFNVIHSDLSRTLEAFGLRMITYSALVLIVDNPGLRPSHLADALAIERPNLVVIVDELVKRGLIRRERDPDDRRAHALTATPAGQELCRRAVKAARENEATLMANVSDAERETVLRVLAEIERAGSPGAE